MFKYYIRNIMYAMEKDFLSYLPLIFQIRHSVLQGNPNGCWDFWGYLGDWAGLKYATKEGRQMKGIARMVEKIAGISLLQ